MELQMSELSYYENEKKDEKVVHELPKQWT